MLTAFKTVGEEIQPIPLSEPLKGCWIRLINPAEQELAQTAAIAGVPEKFLRFAFEEDACPRIVRGVNCLLIIINVPIRSVVDQYNTTPLSIILTPDLNITVSREETAVLPNGAGEDEVFDTAQRSQFVFQLLYRTSSLFLRYIHQIRQRTDEIEVVLRRSTNNQEVFILLDLEKGLTYFTAALRANLMVAETIFRLRTDPHLQDLLPAQRKEEDILETVIIENKRALDLVQTYSDILSSMMDAFSSVIANNLNHMMKFLASITILVSVPTMISSFWSMSLNVPWQGTEAGFWGVVFLSLSASGLVGIVLYRRRMF